MNSQQLDTSIASTTSTTSSINNDSISSNRYNGTMLDFLKEHRSLDKSHTHVLVGPPHGSFSIGSRLKQFWQLYIDTLKNNSEPLYLAEQSGKEAPVLVDIDLKAKKSVLENPLKENDYLYTNYQLEKIVKVYQETLKEILVDLKEEALTCIVLEKEWSEQCMAGIEYIKNGIHLHFPKLFIDRKIQAVYLIPLVKERLKGLFDDIDVTNFIDENSINVHWLMYGSRKPKNRPYVATRCFLDNCKLVSFEEGLNDYVLPALRIGNGSRVSVRDNCKDRVMELMPRILSTALYGRDSIYFYRTHQSINTPITSKFSDIKLKRTIYAQKTIASSLEEAVKYLDLISDKRADDRSDWLRIGFCLWDITEGDDDGMTAWLQFSEKGGDKFDECDCIDQWNSMRKGTYTIGTLKWYAKQDDPAGYEKLTKQLSTNLLANAVRGTHNELAQLLFSEYGTEFVCASFDTRIWYRFYNHIWKESEKGVDLRERISNNDAIIIFTLRNSINALIDEQNKLQDDDNQNSEEEESDEDERNNVVVIRKGGKVPAPKKKKPTKKPLNTKTIKEYEKKIAKIQSTLDNCKMAPFKGNVMAECAEIFRNHHFAESLNTDKYLIAFQNGVYDFKNDVFRDGVPEDYLSEQLPIEYIDYGNHEHPEIMEIDDFFRKIFPDQQIRDYFLDRACHVFIGGNADKLMLLWTGTGDNGKTITQKLFEKMLGKFAIKFSTTLVTGKKGETGAASPELARAGSGVRWAVMDEPNNDEMMNSGIMKALTGNDSYMARDLFEKGKQTREIIPMFKLHMICNKLPAIRNGDSATWNRVRVIPFESKFVNKELCPDTYEEQMEKKIFPIDRQLEDKMDHLLSPLAWYLIQRWKSYDKMERIEPEKVKVATNSYKYENDIYRQFRDTKISNKDNSKLLFDVVSRLFKEWYREEYSGVQMPSATVIKQSLIEIMGDLINGRYWEGYILTRDNPQDDSSDYESDDNDDIPQTKMLRIKNIVVQRNKHPLL